MIRTAQVQRGDAGLEVLRSRLACHLLELLVDLDDGPQTPDALAFVLGLVSTPLPALEFVRLRGFTLPPSLPLAPRLVSLLS